jgi:hypothetical protein
VKHCRDIQRRKFALPQWATHGGPFTLRVFPRALLARPLNPLADPPWRPASIYPSRENLDTFTDKIVGMSVMCILGKKSVHKSAVIRRKIATRLKTALSLIVTRGANVEKRISSTGKDRKLLVFDEEDGGGKKWTLSGAF